MDDKGKGIIAYVFGLIGGLIVLLAFKKDNNKKTTIHACQSITISIAVLAVNIAYNALREEKNVCYITLEVPKVDMSYNFLSRHSFENVSASMISCFHFGVIASVGINTLNSSEIAVPLTIMIFSHTWKAYSNNTPS